MKMLYLYMHAFTQSITCRLCVLQVTQMQLTGDWSAAQVREGLELAMGGCQQLRAVVRQTLLEAALGSGERQAAEVDTDMIQ
jgi:hypothetical protein